MRLFKKLLTFFFVITLLSAQGAVRLPKLLGNGMILQRNANVRIWGWADQNENIKVEFIGKKYETIANSSGDEDDYDADDDAAVVASTTHHHHHHQ